LWGLLGGLQALAAAAGGSSPTNLAHWWHEHLCSAPHDTPCSCSSP
jgi:hypothetical protein